MNIHVKPFEIQADYATTQEHVAPKLEMVELDTKKFSLCGNHVDVGQKMPTIELMSYNLSSFITRDQIGKKTIYVTMPSLDTSVCHSQFLSFLHAIETEGLTGVDFVFVSSDTPFALQRYQKNVNTNHHLLSDSANHMFGFEMGLQIAGLNVITRAIIVTDEDNNIVYMQRVPKLTLFPNLYTAYKSLL